MAPQPTPMAPQPDSMASRHQPMASLSTRILPVLALLFGAPVCAEVS